MGFMLLRSSSGYYLKSRGSSKLMHKSKILITKFFTNLQKCHTFFTLHNILISGNFPEVNLRGFFLFKDKYITYIWFEMCLKDISCHDQNLVIYRRNS